MSKSTLQLVYSRARLAPELIKRSWAQESATIQVTAPPRFEADHLARTVYVVEDWYSSITERKYITRTEVEFNNRSILVRDMHMDYYACKYTVIKEHL